MKKTKRELMEEKINLENERQKTLSMANNLKDTLTKNADDYTEEQLLEKQNEVEILTDEIANIDENIVAVKSELEKSSKLQKQTISTTEHLISGKKSVKDVRKSDEYLKAFDTYIRTGNDSHVKSLTTGVSDGTTANQAGVLVPTITSTEIETRIKEYGGFLSQSNRTTLAAIMSFPILVSSTGAVDHDEDAAAIDDEDLVFGEILINCSTINKTIKWTDELAAMSAVDLSTYLALEFTDEIFYRIDSKILNGTLKNGKGYKGILNSDAAYCATMYAGAELGFDTLIGTLGLVKSKPGKTVQLHMNKTTYFNTVMAMKDDNNRPILNVIGNNESATYYLWGMKVNFTDLLPEFNSASDGDAVIVALADNAYRVNAPAGFNPIMIYNPYTEDREGKVHLTGRVFSGGALCQYQGAAKILKGDSPLA